MRVRNVLALLFCVPAIVLALSSAVHADAVNSDDLTQVDIQADTAAMDVPNADLNLEDGATDNHRRWGRGWGGWGRGWGRGWGWGGWGGWGGYGWPYYGYSYWPYYSLYSGWGW